MKKDAKILKWFAAFIATIGLLLATTAASAAESAVSNDGLDGISVLDYLTDKDGKYTGPTVEQNVTKMDTDKNGFADVTEVRAFLASIHGSEYQKAVLDRWEVRALGGGCPIPFAKEFLSESK